MTPTQRTLAALRDHGYTVGVCEYWQASFAARAVLDAALDGNKAKLRAALELYRQTGPGKRQDLFGFLDIVAIGRGQTLGVQCTATSSMSARITKIQTERQAEAVDWLRDGNLLEVWGWKKYAKAEERKFWRPTVKRLTLASNGGISVE